MFLVLNTFKSIASNIINFAVSLPTVVLALLIIAIILKLIGVTVRGIVKAIITSFIISIVLGAFGVTLPTFSEIFSFIASIFNKIKNLIS